MITLILCAGDQARFNEDFKRLPQPKQLLPVHGAPLLSRTIEQAKPYGSVVVVTASSTIAEATTRSGARPWEPKRHNKTVTTLWSTKELWATRTAILLGDVYYKTACLHHILSSSAKIAFFGDVEEIFGLSFTPHRTLDHAIARAKASEGKLWNLYRAYEGLPLEKHTIRTNGALHYIEDGTADIDTWQEYQNLLRRLS